MRCFIPDCDNPAPYGFRRSGLFSAIPKRGYLWACTEHREEAEARKAKADGFNKQGD